MIAKPYYLDLISSATKTFTIYVIFCKNTTKIAKVVGFLIN